ncbi:unnamed protein product [Choristocarpus tenellus]
MDLCEKDYLDLSEGVVYSTDFEVGSQGHGDFSPSLSELEETFSHKEDQRREEALHSFRALGSPESLMKGAGSPDFGILTTMVSSARVNGGPCEQLDAQDPLTSNGDIHQCMNVALVGSECPPGNAIVISGNPWLEGNDTMSRASPPPVSSPRLHQDVTTFTGAPPQQPIQTQLNDASPCEGFRPPRHRYTGKGVALEERMDVQALNKQRQGDEKWLGVARGVPLVIPDESRPSNTVVSLALTKMNRRPKSHQTSQIRRTPSEVRESDFCARLCKARCRAPVPLVSTVALDACQGSTTGAQFGGGDSIPKAGGGVASQEKLQSSRSNRCAEGIEVEAAQGASAWKALLLDVRRNCLLRLSQRPKQHPQASRGTGGHDACWHEVAAEEEGPRGDGGRNVNLDVAADVLGQYSEQWVAFVSDLSRVRTGGQSGFVKRETLAIPDEVDGPLGDIESLRMRRALTETVCEMMTDNTVAELIRMSTLARYRESSSLDLNSR